MRRRTIILLAAAVTGAGLLSYSPAFAQTPPASGSMAAANVLYEHSLYADAVSSYVDLVDSGVSSSDLYYNLGNAYFRSGDLGRALLSYKRAAQIDPGDGDIRANLDLVRGRTVDGLGPGDEPRLAPFARAIRASITAGGVGAAALALWSETILLSFLLWRIGPGRTRRRVRNALAVVTPLLVLALLALVSTSYADDPNAGVVVADEVTLFSGLGESYIRELTLHSGTEVAIVETRRGWLRIAVPGGETQGWAPGDTIERVSPPG